VETRLRCVADIIVLWSYYT